MTIIRIYEDDKTIIKVSEEDGEGLFSFGFYSDNGPTIFRSSLEEEAAIKLFNKSVRSYLAALDKEEDEKETLAILAEFEPKN